MIYHLLRNPLKYQNLTKEIRSSFESEEDIKGPAINSLKYLNAVINESLRLSPPAPETTRRITNPGGSTICGDHIPGGVRSPFPTQFDFSVDVKSLDPGGNLPLRGRTLRTGMERRRVIRS